MRIHVTTEGVFLSESGDFKRLDVVADEASTEEVDAALRDAGAGAATADADGGGSAARDGAHAWLDVLWLRTHVLQAGDSPERREGFQKMIAFATTQGWVNSVGEVRAHVV